VIKEEAKKAIRAKRVLSSFTLFALIAFFASTLYKPLQVELFMFISAHQSFAPNLKVNPALTLTG